MKTVKISTQTWVRFNRDKYAVDFGSRENQVTMTRSEIKAFFEACKENGILD